MLKSNGTSVYWAADDNSQTVTGVKGNSESSYRTGNVNITAANIGLGNVENTKLSTWAGSANITTLGTISSGTVPWARLSGVPSSFTPATHTHYELTTIGDQRSTATTPNTYSNKFIFQGLKSKATIGSPSEDNYSYVLGLRGWSDSSGGDSHELAFNNTGLYWRHGATTSWGSWNRVYTTGNKPTASDVGLGNVENKSSATIRGELTSSNVTTALGFTPYNSTNPNGYTTNTGTVTKVTAGTGLSIGTTAQGNFTTTGTINHTNSVTAQTTQALYPIKIDAQGHISAYGSAVTSLPASDVSAWAKASTKPSYALSEITGADDVKAIEGLTGTSGILKKTAANTWTLDTTAYTTNTGTVTKITAGTGLNTSADQADSATKGSITTTGTLYLTKSGATAGSYGPSAAVTGSHGTTMNVPYVTVDAYGRVTSISNKVYTAQNTWRGIQDNLTSSNNTTESLSAKQGYLLANGDARDSTKVLKTGDTMSGQLIVNYDDTSGTEYPIVIQRNKAGTSNAGVATQVKNTGSGLSVSLMIGAGGSNHGLYSSGYYDGTTYTTDGKWIVYRNSTGAITLNGNAATATKLATPRTLWGQSFDGSANITGNLISPTVASGWLNGQQSTRGAYNVSDATDSYSYWPWMRQTNTDSAKWFSFGTLGTKFYWIGSSTSRTANGYDYGMEFDVASGRFFANILNTLRRGTGTPSGGADGDVYFQYS